MCSYTSPTGISKRGLKVAYSKPYLMAGHAIFCGISKRGLKDEVLDSHHDLVIDRPPNLKKRIERIV